MPVNDTTTNQGYQKPNIANQLSDDVGRLRSALDSIDTDMAARLPKSGGTMTGAVAFTAGTAALPSLTISGDPNTGIYSPGADQLAISTGGAGRLFVASDGKVGIGTSIPGSLLTLRSASSPTACIENNSSSGQGILLFRNGGTNYGLSDKASIKAVITDSATGATALTLETSPGDLASPTERARLDASGRLLVGTSTATANGGVLQVSNGITFPATQSACSDANTLDDYEEGTWTPTDASGGGLTFTAASGRYTRVGRLITLSAGVTFPTTADGNAVKIGGLPFNNVTGTQGGGVSSYVNGAAPGVVLRSQDNAANILVTNITDQDASLTNATFSGRDLQFTYTYQV